MGVRKIYHEHNVSACFRKYMKDKYVGYRDYRQLILFIVNERKTNFYVCIRYEIFDSEDLWEEMINTRDRTW